MRTSLSSGYHNAPLFAWRVTTAADKMLASGGKVRERGEDLAEVFLSSHLSLSDIEDDSIF